MNTSNHKVENLDASLKITITTPRPWGQIFINGVMLVFIPSFLTFVLSKSSSLPVMIFAVIAMSWEIWGTYYFLRLVFGKEIIEANKSFILISNSLIGFNSTHKYTSELVQEIRVLPNPYTQEYRTWSRAEMFWDTGDGLISLKFNSQDIRIGRWLDVAEAQEIVNVIQESFPQYGNGKIRA